MSYKPVYSEPPITTRALDRMYQAARAKPLPGEPVRTGTKPSPRAPPHSQVMAYGP